MSEGTRYRFVVNSAEQAVKVLRERLGEDARVISVKQVEGVGLAKFLRAPKLEVIAEKGGVPQSDVAQPEDEMLADSFAPRAPSPAAKRAVQAAYERPLAEPSPELTHDASDAPVAEDALSRLLHRSGFSDKVVARLKWHRKWPEIVKSPVRKALASVAELLREEHDKNPQNPIGTRVAFLGTPGVGKTTALCKQLGMEVMYKQKHPAVFKVDMEKPNPGDGLAAFCDVLGVPMYRSASELGGRSPNQTLYVDLPGLNPAISEEIVEAFDLLERLEVSTRVLVVNAAYDASAMKRAYRLGSALGATHVIFSHMDEVTEWGKLWDFVLAPELTPLFLSSGQNIGADYSEEVLETILERSFPGVGKEPAMHASAL